MIVKTLGSPRKLLAESALCKCASAFADFLFLLHVLRAPGGALRSAQFVLKFFNNLCLLLILQLYHKKWQKETLMETFH